MKFDDFKNRFLYHAKQTNLTGAQIEKCLSYAGALAEKGAPIIFDATHFSQLVGYKVGLIYKAARSPINFYRKFKILKRDGASRTIHEPLPSLKHIQRWILDNILEAVAPNKHAKAFIKGLSLSDNARFHTRQTAILTVDIEDFFGTIQFPRVLAQFEQIGYTRELSVLLANLCCLNNTLPQGAPTSPYLANLVSGRMDRRIASYAKKRKMRYTRYADDMTFSNISNIGETFSMIEAIVTSEGFKLKAAKTRVMRPHQQQLVTGLVVNKSISVPASYRRKIRQELYYIRKFGISDHKRQTNETRHWYISHLEGKINHVIANSPNHATAALSDLRALREIRKQTS